MRYQAWNNNNRDGRIPGDGAGRSNQMGGPASFSTFTTRRPTSLFSAAVWDLLTSDLTFGISVPDVSDLLAAAGCLDSLSKSKRI